MVEIKEVVSKKDIKNFVKFPHILYKGNPYFVPFLDIDEINKFDKNKNESYDDCIVKCFLAYKDGKIVGRVAGIIQKLYNQKVNEKRVRFSRFDSINDQEVANKLFSAVENWAKEQGMNCIHGPMGYNDLDREGLLIEGFDQMSSFEEQYNYDYYESLIQACGYEKEVEWVESKIYAPDEGDDSLARMSELIKKRYKLRIAPADSVDDFLEKYADPFFDLLDRAYYNIYGTVPFTDGMKKMLISNFKLVIDLKHAGVIIDENDNLVALGLCFPSMSKAVQKSYGHLTPMALARLLKAIKHPQILDLGLIAVAPEYQNKGVNAIIGAELARMLREDGIEYAETNLNLVDNHSIRNQWKRFNAVQHKRRRAYKKSL